MTDGRAPHVDGADDVGDADAVEALDAENEAEQLKLLARRVEVLERTVDLQSKMLDEAMRVVAAVVGEGVDGDGSLDVGIDVEIGEDGSLDIGLGSDAGDDADTRGYY